MITAQKNVRLSKQSRPGLASEFEPAELRVMDWRNSMIHLGGDLVAAAYAALQATSRPDPMFVAWLSEGHLAVVNGVVMPVSDEGRESLFEAGFMTEAI